MIRSMTPLVAATFVLGAALPAMAGGAPAASHAEAAAHAPCHPVVGLEALEIEPFGFEATLPIHGGTWLARMGTDFRSPIAKGEARTLAPKVQLWYGAMDQLTIGADYAYQLATGHEAAENEVALNARYLLAKEGVLPALSIGAIGASAGGHNALAGFLAARKTLGPVILQSMAEVKQELDAAKTHTALSLGATLPVGDWFLMTELWGENTIGDTHPQAYVMPGVRYNFANYSLGLASPIGLTKDTAPFGAIGNLQVHW